MQLDRCFNNAEVEGDRIVEASACHPMQNLTLSGSHRIEALDHRGFRPPRGIHRNGRNHGVMQCLGPYRLGERVHRSEEHTSELQSLMRISYAVFCLTKKK